MGQAAGKAGVRKTPVRYVAKPVYRSPEEIEAELTRSTTTLKSLNASKDAKQGASQQGPQPWIDERGKKNWMESGARSAPKWWLNTYMELMDNSKEDRIIVSGALPAAWERDKHEPYSLVRNRIDTVDLKWLLEEGRNMPLDELVQHSKLDKAALQNILETVEMPKRQFRNYKGKMVKSVDDTNEHLAQRKEEIKKARELELLRRIGYSDEELAREDQYITNRSRGVAMLDDLGASVKDKQRRERRDQAQISIEEKSRQRIAAIERGEYVPTPQELQTRQNHQKMFTEKADGRFRQLSRRNEGIEAYTRELGGNDGQGVDNWLESRRKHDYGPNRHVGVPAYRGELSAPREASGQGENNNNVFKAAEENYATAWKKFTEDVKAKKEPPAEDPQKPPLPPPGGKS